MENELIQDAQEPAVAVEHPVVARQKKLIERKRESKTDKHYLKGQHNKLRHREPRELVSEILSEYIDGRLIADIAKELKVSPPRLYALVLQFAEDEFKHAQAANALTELAHRQNALAASESMVEVAKNTQLIKSAQWLLEKVCRRIYGLDVPQAVIQFNVGNTIERMHKLEKELGIEVIDESVEGGGFDLLYRSPVSPE